MDPVGFTSCLTAAARARETERPDRFFNDEFAAALAGPEGFAFLDRHWVAFGGTPRPNFAVRTRFFDDFLLATARTRGVRQECAARSPIARRSPQLVTYCGARSCGTYRSPKLIGKAALGPAFPCVLAGAIP
jgi:hypothetical protein